MLLVNAFVNQLLKRFLPIHGWGDRRLPMSRIIWVAGRSISW